jgi:hypothetical protein
MYASKKSILIGFLLILAANFTQAQVGVGTTSPAASAQLDVSSTTKGFLPPRMTTLQRNAISNPAIGLVIFNTTTNTLNIYFSGAWYQLCSSLASGSIATLITAPITNYGTLEPGVEASGVYSDISYTGGNGENYSGQTVTSTSVTGLTATLSGGAFAVGNGTLTYNITGAPSRAGAANFQLIIGGKTGTFTRIVTTPGINGTEVYHWVNSQLYRFDGTNLDPVFSNPPNGNLGGMSYLGVINGKAYHHINGQDYSFDGTNWDPVFSNPPPGLFGGDSYLGVINGKAYHTMDGMVHSFDGLMWESYISFLPDVNFGGMSYLGVINGIAYHHDIFSGQVYFFDGTNMGPVSSNPPNGNLGSYSYLGVINGKAYHWVNGNSLYSFDGINWEILSSTPPGGNLGGMSYLGVINGKAYHNIDGQVYSFDGLMWEPNFSFPPIWNLGGWLFTQISPTLLAQF